MKDKYILKTVIKVRALIQDQQGKYLLLKRNGTAKRNGYKWELPGGKLEKNESFQEALYREVLEETGIKIITSINERVIRNLFVFLFFLVLRHEQE